MRRLSDTVEAAASLLPAGPALRAALGLARLRREGLALLYHRIVDDPGSPRPFGPTLPLEAFRRHLEILGNAGTIVPLRQLLDLPGDGRQVRFALTFDDDDPGYVETVLPVLRSLGVPATFFLSGRRLHSRGAYGWELLERAILRQGATQVAAAIGLRDASARDIASVCESPERTERLERLASDQGELHPMTAEHIRTLADAGMEIGFHTVEHSLLSEEADDVVDRVLAEGRKELEEAAGTRVGLFAYPFGKADERIAERVCAAGYDAAFTNRSHQIGPSSHRFLLGRWDTRHRDRDEFARALALRLALCGSGPPERIREGSRG